jgi:ABC-type sugar transport system ATPase subunit
VTHDQVEAMTMGHRIAIMNAGELQQVGPPQEVYEAPTNLFVATFIGNPPMNVFAGSLVGRAGDRTIGVRPEHLRIDPSGPIAATVTVIESLGHERHVVCRLADDTLVIVRQASDQVAPEPGAAVQLMPAPGTLHEFDAAGTRVVTA